MAGTPRPICAGTVCMFVDRSMVSCCVRAQGLLRNALQRAMVPANCSPVSVLLEDNDRRR